nr:hypothetical protein [Helicobacter pylori]
MLSIFFNKDSSYNINPNLKNYLKDSRYPKNFSYAFHLFLIVFEFKYDLNEEDKQYLIEFVPKMKHPLEKLKDPVENLLLWIGCFLRTTKIIFSSFGNGFSFGTKISL